MEHAEKLEMAQLPIPSEQRIDVFVTTPDAELEALWLKHGGKSTFHYPPRAEVATFCGVALFKLLTPPTISPAHYALLQPFFLRAGSEANVFEFDPIRKNFVRRDAEWFADRIIT